MTFRLSSQPRRNQPAVHDYARPISDVILPAGTKRRHDGSTIAER